MVLMLLQTKYKIKIILIITIFFISISIHTQTLDSNKIIDTNLTIQQMQNDSIKSDSSNKITNELSFYEEYIEPTVAVLSVALITILLFSVRSKK